MNQSSLPTFSVEEPNARRAGIVIALAAAVMVTFMAHHPVASPRNTEQLIHELDQHARASAIVHGVLIGTLGSLMLGFTGLADQVGWNRLSVRAGLIAFAIGCVAMASAALMDGFIAPAFAAHYVEAPDAELASFRASSQLLFLALAAAARIGVFSLSLAIVLWSLPLVSRGNACTSIGALGVIVGVIPIILLLAGRLHLDFHGMLAYVVSQAIWYLAIGIQMIRCRV